MNRLEPLLGGYHLFHATRGRLLVEVGEHELAVAAELKAKQLTVNPAEQALLRRRLEEAGQATG